MGQIQFYLVINLQPIQHYEAGTNTNLPTNRFVQAQPMQYAEASTNTNLPTNRFTQPIHTNIPNQNQISTRNDSFNCEEREHTGIQYRSDFARQLQQSEAIPNVQPVTNYNSERPRQTESSTIYHIPQESLSNTHNHLLYNTPNNQCHIIPHILRDQIYHKQSPQQYIIYL